MAELNETPRGNRIRIAFFGLRNAGKSTLVNAFTGQRLAIVSEVAGTTTDPVSKAMEILPLGPCLVTDTAGLDDVGPLGAQRVEKTLGVLEATDIAVWVWGAEPAGGESPAREMFLDRCRRRGVVVLDYRRGDSVEALKGKIAAVRLGESLPGLLEGLVSTGDRVVCVVPIDASAPKGRLILPQQQVIRECLERHLPCLVCQPDELSECLRVGVHGAAGRVLVVTDSQAFAAVNETLKSGRASAGDGVADVRLTSFSILFARQKGDIAAFVRGLKALSALKDGDVVLVAEGCTHHRQCNDIGAVKIPQALRRLTGRDLKFVFSSGADFAPPSVSLVVHCGGCMLTRREVLRRIALADAAGVPIVNYGMLLGLGGLGGLSRLAGLEGIEA